MRAERMQLTLGLAAGVLMGLLAAALYFGDEPSAKAQNAGAASGADALKAELDAIRGKLPDQAHAMKDVGYHFGNLWFAGQAENWSLATFMNQEVLSHLRWAVRIIPVRKDNAGEDVKLEEILQAFENGPWAQLKESIDAKDAAAFDKAYRFTLESCYACHKASDKPYIRLQIPTAPEAPILNFDPAATWPE